jgi:dynein heavy chain
MQHTLPKAFNKEHIELLNDLFEWVVDPCIEFIKFNCKFQLQTSFIHLVTSTMRLFSCLLDEVNQQQAGAEISAPVV